MVCDKITYKNYNEAASALKLSKHIQKRSRDTTFRKDTRAYKCNACGKYHLTCSRKNRKKSVRWK